MWHTINISSSWLAVGWRRGAAGMKLQGSNRLQAEWDLGAKVGSLLRWTAATTALRGHLEDVSPWGQTSHRLITKLTYGKLICLFLWWYMYRPLSEPLTDDMGCSFESRRTISQVDCSFQCGHCIFKLPGSCAGLNGWPLIHPFHLFALWLYSEGQRERKPRREMVAVFSCLSMRLYKCSEHDLAWWIVSVMEAARQEHCLHSLDKRMEGR